MARILSGILQSLKEGDKLSYMTTWMSLEDIKLNELSQL